MQLTVREWTDSQRNELAFWRAQHATGNLEQWHRVGWYRNVCFPGWLPRQCFDGKVLYDIGSGPEGVLHYVGDAALRKIAVDPLMDLFKEVGYVVNKNGVESYAGDGEMLGPVEVLANTGKADVVFCLNCLDHCRAPGDVLRNCRDLLKPGGELVLCCDMRPTELLDAYHKLQVTEQWLLKELAFVGFDCTYCIVPHQTGNPTTQFCAICVRR